MNSENSPGAIPSSKAESRLNNAVRISEPDSDFLIRAEVKVSDGVTMVLELLRGATPRAVGQFYRMTAIALTEAVGDNSPAFVDAFAAVVDAIRAAREANNQPEVSA